MTETGEQSLRERREAIVLEQLMAGFPDFEAEVGKIHHADDAVIGEVRLAGTHDGSWGGIPATGRREKVYFDSATLLRQIGVLPDPATA